MSAADAIALPDPDGEDREWRVAEVRDLGRNFAAVAAFQRLKRQIVDWLAAAEVEEYALGFCERLVVGFLCDFEESFGIGCFDGHCCVDDELQGSDLFGGGGGGGHCC